MKLKQWTKIILVCASVTTLVACHHARESYPNEVVVSDANEAYGDGPMQPPVRTAGLGDESRFNEKHKQLSSGKRTYYFDFDKFNVHDEDKAAIVANAEYLAKNPNKTIILEGHTDPRGSREYNIGLGERRAKSVAQIMAEKGIKPERIRIVSYGAQKLVSKKHSEDEYKLDRRGVLVYTR